MFEFELKSLSKYTIACPKCSKYRDKRNTKTLTVYRDKDQKVRWECSHTGQCEWNVRQTALDPSPQDVDHSMDIITIKPLKPVYDLPKEHMGNKLYWYKDNNGDILYSNMRVDSPKGKVYYPVLLQEDNTTVQIPHWPNIKGLYNQENLKKEGKILIVEGEKTCDAASLLFPNTSVLTWRGGSNNISSANFDRDELKNRVIYLWPDNDDAGRNVMSKIALILSTSEVYMVDVSIFPKGSDLADNLDTNLIKKALKEAKLIHKPEIFYSTLEDIENQNIKLVTNFTTGWSFIDENLKLPQTGVMVLEGRTAHAKTGTAINLSYNILQQGKQVHYFSYEIPANRVFNRFESCQHNLLSIKDFIEKKQLFIYDQKNTIDLPKLNTILDSEDKIRSLIVIDYAQLVPVKGLDQRVKIIELVHTLRTIANKRGFLVLLLSQLTPNYENPVYDSPQESKDLHNTAELVLRVWNKDMEYGHPIYDEVPGNYTIHIKKNRDGAAGLMFGFNWVNGSHLKCLNEVVQFHRPDPKSDPIASELKQIREILQSNIGGF